MTWVVEFTPEARKDLKRLAVKEQSRILRFLADRVAELDSPWKIVEALAGPLAGFWKYRVGDYRIVAKIEDQKSYHRGRPHR